MVSSKVMSGYVSDYAVQQVQDLSIFKSYANLIKNSIPHNPDKKTDEKLQIYDCFGE